MKQEDKELLLRDLCARIPYGVKLQNVNNIESIVKLRSIDLDNDCCEILFYTYQGKALTICDKSKLFRFGKILRYKPYLFPLSSITEEQRNDISKILIDTQNKFLPYDAINSNGFDNLFICITNQANAFINYCLEHHLDVNGLIPKGLAIDATELNIY